MTVRSPRVLHAEAVADLQSAVKELNKALAALGNGNGGKNGKRGRG